jgi:hypothetical protein
LAAEGHISYIRAHGRDKPGTYPRIDTVGTVVIDKIQPDKDNALVMNRLFNSGI